MEGEEVSSRQGLSSFIRLRKTFVQSTVPMSVLVGLEKVDGHDHGHYTY